MKSSKLMVECTHELRVSQAVNYIRNGELCLLPLEFLSCLTCAKTFVMDPIGGRISDHPSEDSKKVFEWYSSQADKARTKSDIKLPTAAEVAAIKNV